MERSWKFLKKIVMERVLFIATNANISRSDGGGLATRAYFNAFCRLYKAVDVMIVDGYEFDNQNGKVIRMPRVGKFAQFVALLRGEIHRGSRFIPNFIKRHHSEYSMVVMNGGVYSGDVIQAVNECGLKAIVIHHNFEREFHRDNRTIASFGGRFLYFVARNERNAYLKSAVNYFLTDSDMQRFEECYGKRENNFVTGVFEPDEVNLRTIKDTAENSVAITCSLNEPQNVVSILDFGKRLLPVLIDVVPDWKLRISGRSPKKKVLDFFGEGQYASNVEIMQSPEDIMGECAKSKIYLCQIEIGGGLKLRVMDGLRLGMPILIHRNSLRGYECFEDAPFVAVYSDEESFKAGLLRLVEFVNSDSYSREEIQQKYLEKFSLESGVERIKRTLTDF